jgi:hypothetical protein
LARCSTVHDCFRPAVGIEDEIARRDAHQEANSPLQIIAKGAFHKRRQAEQPGLMITGLSLSGLRRDAM